MRGVDFYSDVFENSCKLDSHKWLAVVLIGLWCFFVCLSDWFLFVCLFFTTFPQRKYCRTYFWLLSLNFFDIFYRYGLFQVHFIERFDKREIFPSQLPLNQTKKKCQVSFMFAPRSPGNALIPVWRKPQLNLYSTKRKKCKCLSINPRALTKAAT